MGQDYILRMIQQIMMMVASIMAKRERGDVDGALDEIEQQCLQHVGLPLVVVRQTTPDGLADLLAAGGSLRVSRSVTLAELLIQDAELAEQRGNPPLAVVDYLHAFRLINDSIDALGVEDQVRYRATLDDVSCKLRDLGAGLEDDAIG